MSNGPVHLMPTIAVDDEVVAYVRVRVADYDQAQYVAHELLAKLAEVVKTLRTDEDVRLAGIEVALPTWRPVGQPPKVEAP